MCTVIQYYLGKEDATVLPLHPSRGRWASNIEMQNFLAMAIVVHQRHRAFMHQGTCGRSITI